MATRRTGQLVQRSTASSGIMPEDNPDIEGNEGYESDGESGDRKETRLTLMEEVLLLGLKDKEVVFLNCSWCKFFRSLLTESFTSPIRVTRRFGMTVFLRACVDV